MSDLSGYGFLPVEQEHIYECQGNSLLNLQYWRYLGMGHVEVVAVAKSDSNKYFLFEIYGSNGWEHEINRDKVNKLTLDDSLSFTQLKNLLNGRRWCTIESTTATENCSFNKVIEHTPKESS
jgi:hypothetical protein